MTDIIDKGLGVMAQRKFTQPPPRYSDASLSKTAEKLMITRPATFERSIATLLARKYITQSKKTFHPTEVGMNVVKFLVAAGMCFVDLQFTSEMESQLDQVQEGKMKRSDLLGEFWDRLKKDIKKGQDVKASQQKTGHKCPKCGGELLKKHSKFGPFYACENYKKPKKDEKADGCPFMATIGEHGEPVEKKKSTKTYEYADFPCKSCGSKMVKRKSQYGEFYGCSQYPTCKMTASLEGEFKQPKKWKKKK